MIAIAHPPHSTLRALVDRVLHAKPQSDEWHQAIGALLIDGRMSDPQIEALLDWQKNNKETRQ